MEGYWVARQKKVVFRMIATLVLTGSLVASGVPLAMPNSQSSVITDQDITIATESRFVVDNSVPEHAIDVTTHNGIVTLDGHVHTILAKDRATRIVENVRGVKAIVNRIDVVSLDTKTDQALTDGVRTALAKDAATDSYEIQVESRNGVVALRGRVDSWQEKQLSAQVAKSVPGVKAIDNQLMIKPAAIRDDSEIKTEIMRMLQADVFVDDQLIGVMVRNGHVTLTGVVGSVAEKKAAFSDSWVSGVLSVDVESLQVEWWAKDRMRRDPNDLIRSNTKMQQAIELAFSYDPRVDKNAIEVDIDHGIATLRGVVPTVRTKRAAEADAQNTVGVFMVKNLLKVRPPNQPKDSTLESRVRRALENNAMIEHYDINLTVRQGRVFLDGYLDSKFEIAQAIRTVENVSGVLDVINRLVYEPAKSHKSDQALWQEIRQAFWWDPQLYDLDIRIKVEDGHVALTGTVPTIQASRKAIQLAAETGAEKVTSHLQIQHAPHFFSA